MSSPILITRTASEEKIRGLSWHSYLVAEERIHGLEVRRRLMAKENKEGGELPAPIDTRFLIYYTAIRVGDLKILQPIKETGPRKFSKHFR